MMITLIRPSTSSFEQVQENLRRLSSDMDAVKEDIRSAVETAAAERLAQVQAQKERDKTRSFPID